MKNTKKKLKKIKKNNFENRSLFDYRHTTVWLSIICATLITNLLILTGHIACSGTKEIRGAVILSIFVFSTSINWVCDKAVNIGRNQEKSLPQTIKLVDKEDTRDKRSSIIEQNKEGIKNERNYK